MFYCNYFLLFENVITPNKGKQYKYGHIYLKTHDKGVAIIRFNHNAKQGTSINKNSFFF